LNLSQAMIQALAKMKVSGLTAPFGSIPSSEFEVNLQADVYLGAIRGATKRKVTTESINLACEKFINGKVYGHDPSKFPAASEFAKAVKDVLDSQFMQLSVDLGPNLVSFIEVRRDLPQAEINKIIAANQPKELPAKAKERAGKTPNEAGAAVVRKFTGAEKKGLSDEDQAAFEATRSQQIKALAESISTE